MASRGLNKVMLIGHLGGDPELRYTSSGVPMATFTLATNESWTDKDGNKQELTEWHRIVAWRKLGEICGQYLTKGKQVFIEGRLQTRSWEDQNGVKRYTTEVIANNMQMLGSAGGSGGYNEPPLPEEPPYMKDNDNQQQESTEDDIPF